MQAHTLYFFSCYFFNLSVFLHWLQIGGKLKKKPEPMTPLWEVWWFWFTVGCIFTYCLAPIVSLEGRVTVNQFEITLSDHLYPVTKHLCPDASGLWTHQRACWLFCGQEVSGPRFCSCRQSLFTNADTFKSKNPVITDTWHSHSPFDF